ncbi:MAG: hypothetical protein ACLGGX_00080 [Bdellovibrionia bacterium]
MINQQNQEVRASGVFLTSLLVAACAFVLKSPWSGNSQQLEAEKALQKAQVVGYQIVQLYREATPMSGEISSNSRMPASANSLELRLLGTMSTDPWGQPYRYRFIKESDEKLKVIVWSAGPNQKIETNELEKEESLILEQPKYEGDDLGITIAL